MTEPLKPPTAVQTVPPKPAVPPAPVAPRAGMASGSLTQAAPRTVTVDINVPRTPPPIQFDVDFDPAKLKVTPTTAPKIMFVGESGMGKTVSAAKLCEHGIITAVMAAEDVTDTLVKHYEKHIGKTLFIMSVPQFTAPLDTLITQAAKSNQMDYASLCKAKDANRTKANEYEMMLRGMGNFVCSLSGAKLGSVDTWNKNYCLVVDSLSAISAAAKRLIVGTQTAIDKSDWGQAMQVIEQLLQKLCFGLQCWVVMTAHPAVETDEVTGATRVFANTLGQKLAPTIPRMFAEVIEPWRRGNEFGWSTVSNRMALKNRTLAASNNLPVSFEPLLRFMGQWPNAQAGQTP